MSGASVQGSRQGAQAPFPQPFMAGAGSPVGLGQPGLQAKLGPGTHLGCGLRAEDLRVRAQPQRQVEVRLYPGVPLLSEPPAGVSRDHHCPPASFQAGPRAHLLATVSTVTPTWPTALETSISWRPLGAWNVAHTRPRGPPRSLPGGSLLSPLPRPLAPALHRLLSKAEARTPALLELPCLLPRCPLPSSHPTLGDLPYDMSPSPGRKSVVQKTRLPPSPHIKEIRAQRYSCTFIRMAKTEQRTAARLARLWEAGALPHGGWGWPGDTPGRGCFHACPATRDCPRKRGDQDGAQPRGTHQEPRSCLRGRTRAAERP